MIPTEDEIKRLMSMQRPKTEVSRPGFMSIAKAITTHLNRTKQAKIVLCGYNDTALLLVNAFLSSGSIAAIVDSEPHRHDWTFRGVRVISLDEAMEGSPTLFVVTSESQNMLWHMEIARRVGPDVPIVWHPTPPDKQPTFVAKTHDPLRLHLARFPQPNSMMGLPKINFLLEMLKQALPLEGDVLELGVYKGGSSWHLAQLLEFYKSTKHLYAYDLFEHVPPDEKEGIMCLSEVAHLLSFRKEVTLRDGDFTNYLEEVRTRKHCFMHVDIAFSAPWLDACWSGLVPGGIMVLDNFGITTNQYPGKFSYWFEQKGCLVSYGHGQDHAWVTKPANA